MQFPDIQEVRSDTLSSESTTPPYLPHSSAAVQTGLVEPQPGQTVGKDGAYSLRNLSTGRAVDLRDEAEATFGRSFASLIDRADQTVQYLRL